MHNISNKENVLLSPSSFQRPVLRPVNSPLKPFNGNSNYNKLEGTKINPSRSENARSYVKLPEQVPKTPKSQPRTSKSQNQTQTHPDTPKTPTSQTPQDLQAYLLQQYTLKQRQLKDHEKQVERLKFELLELATSIENSKREQIMNSSGPDKTPNDLYKQIHLETSNEIAVLAQSPKPQPKPEVLSTLRNKASSIFLNENDNDYLKSMTKKASTMFNIHNDDLNNIKNKASSMFQNNRKDTQVFLTQQNDRLEDISHKTSRFFNDVIVTLSPKKQNNEVNTFSKKSYKDQALLNIGNIIKPKHSKADLLNSSFNVENLSIDAGQNSNSFIYEDDEDDSHNLDAILDTSDYLDIDDYSSDEERI